MAITVAAESSSKNNKNNKRKNRDQSEEKTNGVETETKTEKQNALIQLNNNSLLDYIDTSDEEVRRFQKNKLIKNIKNYFYFRI
jgi:hypothetical protein